MTKKNMDKILEREVQILKQIPKPQLEDFIERNGERMRSILEEDEWKSNLEIIDALLSWYRSH